MMDFITILYGMEEDFLSKHREAGEKVLWETLARHVRNPERYITKLFTDILTGFEKSNDIFTEEVYKRLHSWKKYRNLSPEALCECLEAIFDFFVAKGK